MTIIKKKKILMKNNLNKRVMTAKEKLEALKVWLTEHGYTFTENHIIRKQIADLFVTSPYVAVKIGENERFFKAVKRIASPFFIRESESVDFIIEKMEHCLEEAEVKHQQARERRKAREAEAKKEAEAAEKPKRKRHRIVRVERVV